MSKVYPFNNKIETALRLLCILNEAFPLSFDTQRLVYFDYLSVHSGDVDTCMESLHPPVPNRVGEIFVRRKILEEGLALLLSYNLIEKLYLLNGIEFRASETAAPFLDSLSSTYYVELYKRVQWTIRNFSSLNINELRALLQRNLPDFEGGFNFEILNK